MNRSWAHTLRILSSGFLFDGLRVKIRALDETTGLFEGDVVRIELFVKNERDVNVLINHRGRSLLECLYTQKPRQPNTRIYLKTEERRMKCRNRIACTVFRPQEEFRAIWTGTLVSSPTIVQNMYDARHVIQSQRDGFLVWHDGVNHLGWHLSCTSDTRAQYDILISATKSADGARGYANIKRTQAYQGDIWVGNIEYQYPIELRGLAPVSGAAIYQRGELLSSKMPTSCRLCLWSFLDVPDVAAVLQSCKGANALQEQLWGVCVQRDFPQSACHYKLFAFAASNLYKPWFRCGSIKFRLRALSPSPLSRGLIEVADGSILQLELTIVNTHSTQDYLIPVSRLSDYLFVDGPNTERFFVRSSGTPSTSTQQTDSFCVLKPRRPCRAVFTAQLDLSRQVFETECERNGTTRVLPWLGPEEFVIGYALDTAETRVPTPCLRWKYVPAEKNKPNKQPVFIGEIARCDVDIQPIRVRTAICDAAAGSTLPSDGDAAMGERVPSQDSSEN